MSNVTAIFRTIAGQAAADVPDDELAIFIGTNFPRALATDPTFREEYQMARRKRKEGLVQRYNDEQAILEKEQTGAGWAYTTASLGFVSGLANLEKSYGGIIESPLGWFAGAPGMILKLTGEDKAIAEHGAKVEKEYQDAAAFRAGSSNFAQFTTALGAGTASLIPSAAAAFFGGMPAAAVAAGAQTFGSVYADAYDAYRKQMPEPQARWKAMGPAVLSGVITAGLTAGFGKFGGPERVLTDLAKGKISIQTFSQLLKYLGANALVEGGEEWADQTAQGILERKTYNPEKTWDQIWKESLMAGVVGGTLGSAVALGGGISAVFTPKEEAPPTPPTTEAPPPPTAPPRPIVETPEGGVIIEELPDLTRPRRTINQQNAQRLIIDQYAGMQELSVTQTPMTPTQERAWDAMKLAIETKFAPDMTAKAVESLGLQLDNDAVGFPEPFDYMNKLPEGPTPSNVVGPMPPFWKPKAINKANLRVVAQDVLDRVRFLNNTGKGNAESLAQEGIMADLLEQEFPTDREYENAARRLNLKLDEDATTIPPPYEWLNPPGVKYTPLPPKPIKPPAPTKPKVAPGPKAGEAAAAVPAKEVTPSAKETEKGMPGPGLTAPATTTTAPAAAPAVATGAPSADFDATAQRISKTIVDKGVAALTAEDRTWLVSLTDEQKPQYQKAFAAVEAASGKPRKPGIRSSKAPEVSGPASPTLARSRIAAAAQRLGPWMMEHIDVVPLAQKPAEVPKNTVAWYNTETKRVTFVEEDFAGANDEHIVNVLQHEIGIHKGLLAAVGEEKFVELTKAVWETLTPEERLALTRRDAEIMQTFREAGAEAMAQHGGEEALAYGAEPLRLGGWTQATWDKVVAVVRDFLRRAFPKLRFSESELRNLLRTGMEYLAAQAETEAAAQADRYGVAGTTVAADLQASLRQTYSDPTIEVKPNGEITGMYDRPGAGNELAKKVKDWARPVGSFRFWTDPKTGLKKMEWEYDYTSDISRQLNGRLVRETERIMVFEPFGLKFPRHEVPLAPDPKQKGVEQKGQIVYPAEAMTALQAWVQTPQFLRLMDPKVPMATLESEADPKTLPLFQKMLTKLRRAYNEMDGPPASGDEKDMLFLGQNSKAGGDMLFAILSCHPSAMCWTCYAGGHRYLDVLDKGVVSLISVMAKPESFGRRLAEEVKAFDPDKKKIRFLRLLRSGDLTTDQQVRAFNETAKNLDREIHVFSRHPDMLMKLQSQRNAPFNKMLSLDWQLVRQHGIEKIRTWKERFGLRPAYLIAMEGDIPEVINLFNENLCDVIFPASRQIYDLIRERSEFASDSACPCDAKNRALNMSCPMCRNSDLYCWMGNSSQYVDPEGNVWDPGDPNLPKEAFPMSLRPRGKKLMRSWLELAKSVMDVNLATLRAGINAHLAPVKARFDVPAEDPVTGKTITKKNWGQLTPYEQQAAYRAFRQAYPDVKLSKIRLRDLRFPGDEVEVDDIQDAEVYYKSMAKLKAKMEKKATFLFPAIPGVPAVGYKDGVRLTKTQLEGVKTEKDLARLRTQTVESFESGSQKSPGKVPAAPGTTSGKPTIRSSKRPVRSEGDLDVAAAEESATDPLTASPPPGIFAIGLNPALQARVTGWFKWAWGRHPTRAPGLPPTPGSERIPALPAPWSELKKVFSQPFAAGRIPILGYLLDPNARLQTHVGVAINTYWAIRGVGKAISGVLGLDIYGKIDPAFEVETTGQNKGLLKNVTPNPTTNPGGSLAPSDVVEALLADPTSYILTTAQQAAFNEIKAILGLVAKLRAFYGLTHPSMMEEDGLPRPHLTRPVIKHPKREIAQSGSTGARVGGIPYYKKSRVFSDEEEGIANEYVYEPSIERRLVTEVERLYKEIADHLLSTDPDLGGVQRDIYEAGERAFLAAMGKTPDQIDQIIRNTVAAGTVRDQPGFSNMLYDQGTVKELRAKFPATDHWLRQKMNSVNNAAKMFKLGYDLGVMFNQGIITFYSHPIIWAKTAGIAMKALLKEGVLEAWAQQRLPFLRETAQYGATYGRLPEFLAGYTDRGWKEKGGVEKSGLEGVPLLGATFRPFMRHFGTFMDIAKAEILASKWEMMKRKHPEQLLSFVRSVESVMLSSRMESIGVGPNQAFIERALFLAPSYYRGGVNLMFLIAEGGESAKEGARAIGSYLAGGVTLFVGMGLALGMDWEEIFQRMDPRRGDFMLWRITLPNGNVLNTGLGGFFRGLTRLAGNIYEKAASSTRSEMLPLSLKEIGDVRLNPEDNPISRWFRGHSAPVPSLLWDFMWEGDDYLGDSVNLKVAFFSLLPLWAQDAIGRPGLRERSLGERALTVGLGVLGVPVYQESYVRSRQAALDKMAREQYNGKKFNALPLDARRELVSEFEQTTMYTQKPPTPERAIELSTKRERQNAKDIQSMVLPEVRTALGQMGLQLPQQVGLSITMNGQDIPLDPDERERYKIIVAQEYSKQIKEILPDLREADDKPKMLSMMLEIAKANAKNLMIEELEKKGEQK